MPIYEYACEKCESEFEVEQRITDDPVTACPKCRSRKVKRLISKTSFVLKGGGWYSDLYASNTSNGDDKKPDSASDTKDSKKDSDSDSKPKTEPTKADKGKSKEKPKSQGKSKAVA